MKISIGNPVTGDDFFDREQEQAQIWRKLERDHVLLLAPRRIGKTSLMRRLCDTAEEHEFKAAMASFAPCDDEMDCIRELTKAIGKDEKVAKKFLKKFSKALKHLKGIKISVFGVGGGLELQNDAQPDWREVGEALAATLAELDGTWLLCVDELPVFVLKLLGGENGQKRTRSFLYWFRDLRQNYHQNVRWILAGSIGMDTVASRLGLGDTINDLDPFPLGAFSDETADSFLACLAESYNLQLDADVRKYMIKRVGWPVPYYLQLLFEKVVMSKGENQAPDRKTVDNAFAELLSPTYKIHFDYWRQRLTEELGNPDSGYALHLLNGACHNPAGISKSALSQILGERIAEPESREEKLRYLLDILENDGYFIQTGDRYHFRLEWLREYWLRRVA